MDERASEPNDLEKLFVKRANKGDVDGLLALYEPSAIVIPDEGTVLTGSDQIRAYFARYLSERPRLAQSNQAPAIQYGEIALTSSQHSNGDVSVEIARRQEDGSWLWIVDQFAVNKART